MNRAKNFMCTISNLFRKTCITVLDKMCKKGILVAKHHSVQNYIETDGPVFQGDFHSMRAKGKLSYVIDRVITIYEEWYYLKSKPDTLKSAFWVLANDKTLHGEIRMRAQLQYFRIHLPGFQSEWVKDTHSRLFRSDGSTYRVDLNSVRPQLVYTLHDVDMEDFTSIVDAMAKDMIEYIDAHGEELNVKICGVEEDYKLFGDVELKKDFLCPRGIPIMTKDMGTFVCQYQLCPEYNVAQLRCHCNKEIHVSHLEWLRIVDKYRSTLEKIVKERTERGV